MAINDKIITEIQEKLVRTYGLEILTLNPADQFFIANHSYVTGSDVLNGVVWREYKILEDIPDGFEFKPQKYISIVGELGIVSKEASRHLKERKSRDLKTKDIEAYKQVFAGKAIFTDADDLKGIGSTEEVVAQTYADLSASVKSEFDRKMIESDFIKQIKRKSDDHTYYVQVKEGREVARRSMQAQGFSIRRKNLATVSHSRGKYRGRFNTVNSNHNGHYESGSWRSGSNAGPRIQGPAGGVGSCKFVIINRSGSI